MIDHIPPESQGKLAHFEGSTAQRFSFYCCLLGLLSIDSKETIVEHQLRIKLLDFFTAGLNFIATDHVPISEVRLIVDGKMVCIVEGLAIPVGYENNAKDKAVAMER